MPVESYVPPMNSAFVKSLFDLSFAFSFSVVYLVAHFTDAVGTPILLNGLRDQAHCTGCAKPLFPIIRFILSGTVLVFVVFLTACL